MVWEACILAWFSDNARGIGRIKISPSAIASWQHLMDASDSWDWGLRHCCFCFLWEWGCDGVIFSHFFSFFSVEQCFLQAEELSWNRFISRAHLGYRVPKGTRIIYIWLLPNREIYITGTAPCSTGTGYSTSMVRLPSWYCPTFFVGPLCSIFLSVYATYVWCSLYRWHDASPVSLRWSTRFSYGFSMLLILSIAIVSHSKVLTLLVLQWTIALSPPPPYWCSQCRGSH